MCLSLSKDFQRTRCLWNAEVAIILEHRLQMAAKEGAADEVPSAAGLGSEYLLTSHHTIIASPSIPLSVHPPSPSVLLHLINFCLANSKILTDTLKYVKLFNNYQNKEAIAAAREYIMAYPPYPPYPPYHTHLN
jgi:hypothetical protein